VQLAIALWHVTHNLCRTTALEQRSDWLVMAGRCLMTIKSTNIALVNSATGAGRRHCTFPLEIVQPCQAPVRTRHALFKLILTTLPPYLRSSNYFINNRLELITTKA